MYAFLRLEMVPRRRQFKRPAAPLLL